MAAPDVGNVMPSLNHTLRIMVLLVSNWKLLWLWSVSERKAFSILPITPADSLLGSRYLLILFQTQAQVKEVPFAACKDSNAFATAVNSV